MTNPTSPLAAAVEFADNPEPRCPCVLLLDTSTSMSGAKIDALNQGLKAFRDDIVKDAVAARRVEVAVVSFNSDVSVLQDFVTADQLQIPTLAAGGMTVMGTGILKALDLVQARKAQYKTNGVSWYRPWIFMITDGEPQGESDAIVEQATRRIKDDEDKKRIAFFAVGVESADMTRLGQIAVRTPVLLRGLNFVEMFVWLSRSTQAVSRSQMDQQIALPPPGWGTV